MIGKVTCAAAALALLSLVSAARAQDDEVFRSLTAEKLEKFLTDQGIKATKMDGQGGKGRIYEFKRGDFNVRLLLPTDGKQLVVGGLFPPAPLEKLNQWNLGDRFARLSLDKGPQGPVAVLEYRLDLSGGVTEGTLKQFLARFDDEVKGYVKYAGGTETKAEPKVVAGKGGVMTDVSNAVLEKVLTDLRVEYKKQTGKGITVFEFEKNNHKVQLHNFGGKDLMLDAYFPGLPLEDTNAYNLKRKFIRAVNYKTKAGEYTALEANLDCLGGVTEGMIRHFITTYDEDVKHFGGYAQKVLNK